MYSQNQKERKGRKEKEKERKERGGKRKEKNRKEKKKKTNSWPDHNLGQNGEGKWGKGYLTP